jgi:glycosyltransferase involved in cell wall biosynthesis
MKNKKKMSVIMTNYNYSQYLEKSILAILNQTRLPDEFIIFDDASTDNSVEIIENLIKNYSFVKLIKNKINMGPVEAFNFAFKFVTSEYFYAAASDDFILPEFIKKNMNLIEENDLAMCCSTPRVYIDEINYFDILKVNSTQIFTPDQIANVMNKNHFFLAGNTTILKKKIYCEMGEYDINLKQHCDIFLHHKIAMRYNIGYISQALACIRSHLNSYSVKNRDQNTLKNIYLKIFDEIKKMKNKEKKRFKKSRFIAHFRWPVLKTILIRPWLWNFLFYISLEDYKLILIEQFRKIKHKKC